MRAQNLVPNGDFEKYHQLPDEVSQWDRCVGWTNAGGLGSTDYYNTKGIGNGNIPNTGIAYVQAYSKNAIMGFIAWEGGITSREYLQAKLIKKLRPNKSYIVSYWLTNGFKSFKYNGYSINSLGLVLSTKALQQKMGEVIRKAP